MTSCVVKCQLSLSSTLPMPTILFYTEDRKKMNQFEATREWIFRFDRKTIEGHKFFAEVE